MCLSAPYRVLETDGLTALVAYGDRQRQVSLLLMDEAVAVGDHVLVQVGDFAFQKVSAEQAAEAEQWFGLATGPDGPAA